MPSPPAALREQIISRIKVQSRLDIAEKRLPQDGRMQLPLERRLVDMRVSSLPTLHGEKIVLRILDLQTHQLGFEALGLGEVEREHLLQAIAKPNGMVLITGPTGSGKTVTLYTCLNHLNTTGVNIATVEDPSEIVLPGANQVNVNERIGLTFDTALRALLRQDPDILMVGEIRDLATADMAVKASQTGHLVLSTLHTNDAPSTLTRLNHMGIAGFNLASSVILICAQRLVRRLCPSCKQPLPDGSGYQAVGCATCIDGYKGRVAIHQVMPVTAGLQQLIPAPTVLAMAMGSLAVAITFGRRFGADQQFGRLDALPVHVDPRRRALAGCTASIGRCLPQPCLRPSQLAHTTGGVARFKPGHRPVRAVRLCQSQDRAVPCFIGTNDRYRRTIRHTHCLAVQSR